MNRIVIIGSPGSGKSTLARKLGRKLQIQVVHLDRIFWQPGWKEKPRNTRIEILKERVRKKQWIIEGTYLDSSEPRLEAADTIIFLDIPYFLCLQRIIKQHFQCKGHPRYDLKEGCKDELNLIRILKVLGFPFRGRRTLKQKLPYYKSKSKEIIWLRSTKEVESFLARQEERTNVKKKITKTHSVSRKKQLATAR
jgi:adenylate kinase family enzyme